MRRVILHEIDRLHLRETEKSQQELLLDLKILDALIHGDFKLCQIRSTNQCPIVLRATTVAYSVIGH
jgi:hypothetical protein